MQLHGLEMLGRIPDYAQQTWEVMCMREQAERSLEFNNPQEYPITRELLSALGRIIQGPNWTEINDQNPILVSPLTVNEKGRGRITGFRFQNTGLPIVQLLLTMNIFESYVHPTIQAVSNGYFKRAQEVFPQFDERISLTKDLFNAILKPHMR